MLTICCSRMLLLGYVQHEMIVLFKKEHQHLGLNKCQEIMPEFMIVINTSNICDFVLFHATKFLSLTFVSNNCKNDSNNYKNCTKFPVSVWGTLYIRFLSEGRKHLLHTFLFLSNFCPFNIRLRSGICM